jgi:hypothetical protein
MTSNPAFELPKTSFLRFPKPRIDFKTMECDIFKNQVKSLMEKGRPVATNWMFFENEISKLKPFFKLNYL